MAKYSEKAYPIDKITHPVQKFIQHEKAGGLALGLSVIVAMFLANSAWSDEYFNLLGHKFGFTVDGKSYLEFSILHWINDGLMSVFFFVVGLELKREIVGGELSNLRKAILPIGAAIGGMAIPALIYLIFNPSGEAQNGWGIPMATDIAFALGILVLIGKKVPLALKVFLTALAIVDDLGAVLVIALFYTSEISLQNLALGVFIAGVMYGANRLGVRNMFFYAILGILGVWIAFLLSGVHATIASVIAAFTIPADVRIKEGLYISQLKEYIKRFKNIDPNDDIPTLKSAQLHILDEIKKNTNKAIPPLQRLEHAMHPFVVFFIIPIFALANAGISLDINVDKLFATNIAIGIAVGLIGGKVLGITGATYLLVKLKIATLPKGMNLKNIIGLSFLAGIGFTMSLFITSLAFTNPEYVEQAKIGIFTASILSGIVGYFILKSDKSHLSKSSV